MPSRFLNLRVHGGKTLFLDEIGDIPVDLQPKLLRFLENREIHPLGEAHPTRVDVRVIAATNVILPDLIASGRFREDLFYRLNVVPLHLPPLRDRREEIPALAAHFIRRFAAEERKGTLTLSDDALECLLLYRWPGNVRQLANEIHRVVAMADADSVITAAHLAAQIRCARWTAPAPPSAPAAGAAAEPAFRLNPDEPLPAAVERLERLMVEAALSRADGRMEDAARLLGISRKGLFLKRRRWGLVPDGCLCRNRTNPERRLHPASVAGARALRDLRRAMTKGSRCDPRSSIPAGLGAMPDRAVY